MLVRGVLIAACLVVLASPSMARAPEPRNLGDIGVPVSGPAVTFGGETAIPSGYYQLCKNGSSVCQKMRGANAVAEGGVVRFDARLKNQLAAVNAEVNRSIRPVEDSVQFHVADRWSVGPKKGDCEDFALTKKARLLKLGWPSSALLIATANTASGAEHAVLIARTDRGDFVLDNLRKDVRPWSAGLYRWKAIQAPGDVWTWYQFGRGTIRVASIAASEVAKPLTVVSMAEPEQHSLALDLAQLVPITVAVTNKSVVGAIADIKTSMSIPREASPSLQFSSAWVESYLRGANLDWDWTVARADGDRCSKEVMAGETSLWSVWLAGWSWSQGSLAWAGYRQAPLAVRSPG